MKIFSLIILFFAAMMATANAQPARLKVVTTTPDLAAIVKEIGGDAAVQVESLAAGEQNPHFVDAKPSFVLKLMKADFLVVTGMDLEIGWLPPLLQSCANPKIQADASGFLDASKSIEALEIPSSVSRDGGDVHPFGNPHYMLDPENARKVAAAIKNKLSELNPDQMEKFEKNYENFDERLQKKIAEWKKILAPYQGEKWVSYHEVYPYFAERFGFVKVGTIEPKPGIPPTAKHTADLIAQMQTQKVRMIWTEPWYESRSAQSIAQKTGATVISINLMPCASTKTTDYISVIDKMVDQIAQALKQTLNQALK